MRRRPSPRYALLPIAETDQSPDRTDTLTVPLHAKVSKP